MTIKKNVSVGLFASKSDDGTPKKLVPNTSDVTPFSPPTKIGVPQVTVDKISKTIQLLKSNKGKNLGKTPTGDVARIQSELGFYKERINTIQNAFTEASSVAKETTDSAAQAINNSKKITLTLALRLAIKIKESEQNSEALERVKLEKIYLNESYKLKITELELQKNAHIDQISEISQSNNVLKNNVSTLTYNLEKVSMDKAVLEAKTNNQISVIKNLEGKIQILETTNETKSLELTVLNQENSDLKKIIGELNSFKTQKQQLSDVLNQISITISDGVDGGQAADDILVNILQSLHNSLAPETAVGDSNSDGQGCVPSEIERTSTDLAGITEEDEAYSTDGSADHVPNNTDEIKSDDDIPIENEGLNDLDALLNKPVSKPDVKRK